MGFFFRKSLKLGLFRINLSKSGIGGSVGVKGLRVGRSAKGQNYISAGAGGVGYRKVLSSKGQSAAAQVDSDYSPGERNREILVLLAKTDLLDSLLVGRARVKYFETYGSVLRDYNKLITGLHPRSLEALLLQVMITLYGRGHNEAGGPEPEMPIAVGLYEKARHTKYMLRSHLQGTLTEEEKQVLLEIYEARFPLEPEVPVVNQAGMTTGQFFGWAIAIILVGVLVSWCSVLMTDSGRSNIQKNNLAATPFPVPSPTPTPAPKRKRR